MAARPKLRFGLWYAFRNPAEWQTTDQALYAEVIDQIAWAETIGYDDCWLTEHHFVDDAHAPSPLVQAAAIAVRTKKIRIGTAVLLLPLYHPVRVADQSTYPEPHQYATGVSTVLVAGTVVIDGGDHTGALPGRVLRRGADGAPPNGGAR